MPKQRTIVFDTETTGLLLHPQAALERQPRIIEFGAVLLEDGAVVHDINLLINPQQELSAEITKITGMTDDDLRGKPPFAEVLPFIKAAFAGCDLVVAHNLSFDRGMLRTELRRCGVTDFPWPQKGICTVELFRELFGRRPNLKVLYQHVMGKPLDQTHRASGDVSALVEIVQCAEVWKF